MSAPGPSPFAREDGGGRAFPSSAGPGMSLRDWFAGQVLAGALARDAAALLSGAVQWDETAKRMVSVEELAYRIADRMLRARRGDK